MGIPGLALFAENLSHSYGMRSIIRNVNFELASSELLHLKGANGVGKSTLLTLLAGLRRIQDGFISLKIPQGATFALPQAYLAADHNGLYLSLDGFSNLAFWNKLHRLGLESEQLRSVLQFWGLDHPLLDLFSVQNFSTGMKRRLALARLTLTPTALWLLDEPLLGLDQEGCLLFADALKQHLRQGGMCIMATHDHSFFESLSYAVRAFSLDRISRG